MINLLILLITFLIEELLTVDMCFEVISLGNDMPRFNILELFTISSRSISRLYNLLNT